MKIRHVNFMVFIGTDITQTSWVISEPYFRLISQGGVGTYWFFGDDLNGGLGSGNPPKIPLINSGLGIIS